VTQQMPIDAGLIDEKNRQVDSVLQTEFDALGEQLERRGVNIETVLAEVQGFTVAIPIWGVGTGGTRFARFPGPGEPRNVLQKIEDCAVIQDWGTSFLCANELGEKARCLVDLGHHAPSVNIEMIVARLIQFGKLAGFHFNDSKYGDDDLDAGSIQPFQLFLVFNELVDAARRGAAGFDPAYMLDQSHNITDPIESLVYSAAAVHAMYARALIVDRDTLADHQQSNDAMLARDVLMTAYETNVWPIIAMARKRQGGAIDPVGAYRDSGYRQRKADERPESLAGSAGIV